MIFHLVGWTALLTLVSVAVNLLKGKFRIAAAGFLIAPVAWVGALRLARPESPWGRRYPDRKRARAAARFAGAG